MDITASSPIGIYDSQMFAHIMDLQGEAKHFFFFIRKWINEVHEVKMKKMVIFYLVVFYLQREKVLPTLEMVHKGVEKKIVGGERKIFKFNFY